MDFRRAEPDLDSAYAMQIASHAIACIMGLPEETPERLIEWSFNAIKFFP